MSVIPRQFLPAAVALLGVGLVAAAGALSPARADAERIERIFANNDADGDNRISAAEWPRSQSMFKSIDKDGDGYLSKAELGNFFAGGGGPRGGGGDDAEPAGGPRLPGQVPRSAIDGNTIAASMARLSNPVSQQRGLLESTLEPVYPAGFSCPMIDHVYGEEWRGPTPDRIHTGADIPAGWNDPIYAMADGLVVAKFTGEKGNRGLQIVLRHTPEETGLPVWIYTLYSHFSEMPKLNVGDRVRMGDYLGPNGKTGVPGRKREPHLHLTVYYSAFPEYAVTRNFLYPREGHFTDPVALFRGLMPLHPAELRTLPAAQKQVPIVFRTGSGAISRPGARIIWPFACEKS